MPTDDLPPVHIGAVFIRRISNYRLLGNHTSTVICTFANSSM